MDFHLQTYFPILIFLVVVLAFAGANLVITVGLDVDRTGVAYEERVLPDEVVEGPRGPDDEDMQLARALDWLIEQE